jgi:hypothetical protein
VEALGGGEQGPLEEPGVGDGGEVEREVADGDGRPRRRVGGGTPTAEDPEGQVLDGEVRARGHLDERPQLRHCSLFLRPWLLCSALVVVGLCSGYDAGIYIGGYVSEPGVSAWVTPILRVW